MIVSEKNFHIILIVLGICIIIKPLYSRLIRREGNRFDAMYLLLLLLLPVNWYTPKIITVTGCGQYTKEVALAPTTKDGVKISYGKKTHIFNNSNNPIYLDICFTEQIVQRTMNKTLLSSQRKTA